MLEQLLPPLLLLPLRTKYIFIQYQKLFRNTKRVYPFSLHLKLTQIRSFIEWGRGKQRIWRITLKTATSISHRMKCHHQLSISISLLNAIKSTVISELCKQSGLNDSNPVMTNETNMLTNINTIASINRIQFDWLRSRLWWNTICCWPSTDYSKLHKTAIISQFDSEFCHYLAH